MKDEEFRPNEKVEEFKKKKKKKSIPKALWQHKQTQKFDSYSILYMYFDEYGYLYPLFLKYNMNVNSNKHIKYIHMPGCKWC